MRRASSSKQKRGAVEWNEDVKKNPIMLNGSKYEAFI
jgi:hypothetical protein